MITRRGAGAQAAQSALRLGAICAALVAVPLTGCSGGDDDSSPVPIVTTAPTVTTAGSESAESGGVIPGGVPEPGSGDAPVPPALEELDLPSSAPAWCETLDRAVVAAAIGSDVVGSSGAVDPSGREFCIYADSAETNLVRVRLTSADSGLDPAQAFAELGADPAAEPIDEATVRVGRKVARLSQELLEVTILDVVALDDDAAADAALVLLDELVS